MNIANKFKSFIITNRVVYWTLFILIITLTPIIVSSIKPDEVTLVEDSATRDYDEILDESTVNMNLTFDWPCSGKVTVEFYDSSENLLSTQAESFYSIFDNSTFTVNFYNIPGKVETYDIISIESIPDEYAGAIFIYIFATIIAIVLLSLAIASLLLKCKIYEFEGKTIIVYAGWHNHQIFENDILMDECKTGFYLSAIIIGYTDDNGNDINARITTTNSITLKINNRLYN